MQELIQFDRLYDDGESLSSPSGRFVLRYDADGVATVTDQSTGEVRWRAGEPDRPVAGRFLLGSGGAIQVESADDRYEVLWRSGYAAPEARALVLTDDGDFELLDGQRVRLLNSRTGPVDSAALGDAAPVAAITGDRYLLREGGKRRHVVVRNPDGSLQVSMSAPGYGWSHTLIAPLVQWMERQPDTLLTWRILPYDGRKTRELCLVDAEGEPLWRDDMRGLTPAPPPARPHVYGGPELGRGGRLRHQSLTSISGVYTLVHQDDGNLVLYYNPERRAVWATDTWWAGDGWTDLTEDGELVVRNLCGGPVWRSGTAGSDAQWLVVDDEGGIALLDDAGTAVWEVRTGPHAPAPVADVARGSVLRRGETLRRQSLTSVDGGTVLAHRDDCRIVLYGEDGRWLWNSHFGDDGRTHLTLDDDGMLRLRADDGSSALDLGGPGDELVVGRESVVLRREDGTVVWREGEPAATAEEDHTSWLERLNDEAYCVTVIHDVEPDEALRRLGAEPSQVTTGTWVDLMERADLEEAEPNTTVAAFALGPHTLLVEDNGYRAVNDPALSAGTFAVSSYMSVNADFGFIVSRDGEEVDNFGENGDGEVHSPEARRALEEMDAEDVLDTAFEHDIELLCRVAGVRPTVADVSGTARLAILDEY
ncbi:DUF6461 domain-containing protein [Actinoallomurus iriomotensis]|uniref:Bulb-type lectin domain-containing protein n=1 Tax=Actinoallomurus iriomotensis TaxID=478107 RepID=A0A9W6W1G0_9ACTN|nr:DUF6461 domain-containing protein [Actinoallomurus iriomotensis]GLY86767.1 hypothetical protein Airi02_046960 [Actinoallomurus iriomotensis]